MSERFLCIGDSITEGIGDEHGIGWPGRLSEYLSKHHANLWHINNLGLAGNTSKDVLSRIYTEGYPREPQRLLIAAGINDVMHHLWPASSGARLSLEYSKVTWLQIINCVRRLSVPTVIIGLTPVNEKKLPLIYKPYDPQDGGILTNNNSIKIYENMIAAVAKESSIPFIPLYESLSKNSYMDYLDDGVHPSKDGYDMITSVLIKQLENINFFSI